MTGQEVMITAADGASFTGYLAKPAKTPAPGIIVLQEIFGVNSFVRQVVDHLAELGFSALAPDLFWRQEPGLQLDSTRDADRGRAMQLFKNLDEPLAVQDSIAALNFLRNDAALCTGKVAAVGYCLGGRLAYLMATRSDIDAAVGYYGVGIQATLAEAANIHAPLLLHIAGADTLCPPEAQRQIIEGLKPYSDHVSIEVHPGAGHGFARGGPTYNFEATQRADAATVKFLNVHLNH